MRRSSPLKLFLLVAEVENSSVAYSFAFSSGRNLRPGALRLSRKDEKLRPGEFSSGGFVMRWVCWKT
jgi:hypothetical protein